MAENDCSLRRVGMSDRRPACGLEAEIIDPLTMPIPAAWDAFRVANRLPASWDAEALRLLSWTTRRPVRLGVVNDEQGVVAVVCGDVARTAPAYVEPGRPLPTGWFSCRLLIGYRPGLSFRPDASMSLRRRAVRVFEAAYRRHHRRCLGFVYENLDGLDRTFDGGLQASRPTSPGNRIDIDWLSIDDYWAQLPAARAKRFRRIFDTVDADDRVDFDDDLEADPAWASQLDLLVRHRHADRRPPVPLSTSYLARLTALEGTRFVGYRSRTTGRLLAYDLTIDDTSGAGPILMAVVHGSVDHRDGGIRDLYFDLYLREVQLAIEQGYRAIDLGPGMAELKQRFGARPVPTKATVSFR